MEKIVALCKRRGFIFQSSEIYGGLGSIYDYGHYGVLLKNNVKGEWWRTAVQERDDMVALDAAILMHPRTWEASGHLEGFTDPMVDCRTCKLRFRSDKLEDAACGRQPSKHPGETEECDLTEPRQFNLMFETFMGPVRDDAAKVYLRPETAQGIFVNFKNVLQRWMEARMRGHTALGIRPDHRHPQKHGPDELSHSSPATSDIEYLPPMGWSELEGIATRGDYALSRHAEFSGEKLEFFDQEK